MELQVKNIEGKPVKKIQVPDNIYGLDMNEHVLHTVCKAYRANRRQGTHCTKTRSFVRGGKKKPFRQKGTGNARQGSGVSPLMPGGAILHGPRPRDYRQDVNRKTRQLALKVALSDKVRHGQLHVIDDLAVAGYSTKHVVKIMNNLSSKKALFADERGDDQLYRSARNIHGAEALRPIDMNAENVLRYDSLIITESALNALQQRFEEKKS